jgi:hypothetical protein
MMDVLLGAERARDSIIGPELVVGFDRGHQILVRLASTTMLVAFTFNESRWQAARP